MTGPRRQVLVGFLISAIDMIDDSFVQGGEVIVNALVEGGDQEGADVTAEQEFIETFFCLFSHQVPSRTACCSRVTAGSDGSEGSRLR